MLSVARAGLEPADIRIHNRWYRPSLYISA